MPAIISTSSRYHQCTLFASHDDGLLGPLRRCLGLDRQRPARPRPASWVAAGVNGLNQFLTPLSAAQIADFNAAGLNIASNVTVALPPGFVLGTPGLTLNPLGGDVKVLFLGESAGWLNDLGYVLNPLTSNLADPTVYNPLVVNIDSIAAGVPGPGVLVNNSFATVQYGAGDSLDFFLNGVGTFGAQGGTWFTFGTSNQFAGLDFTIHTKYQYFMIDGVDTLVVAFEDARFNGIDGDFSDVIIAFQGVGSAVPEPSTYGLLGAAALLALVFRRRFKRAA